MRVYFNRLLENLDFMDKVSQKTVENYFPKFAKIVWTFEKLFFEKISESLSWLLKIIARFVHWFDQLVIEGFVHDVGKCFAVLGVGAQRIQNGRLKFYLGLFVIGLIVMFGFIFIGRS
ncbi:hypothetical protein ACFLRA_01450 [Bdellovibrionota bacterium]